MPGLPTASQVQYSAAAAATGDAARAAATMVSDDPAREGEAMVRALATAQRGVDEALAGSNIQLFAGSKR